MLAAQEIQRLTSLDIFIHPSRQLREEKFVKAIFPLLRGKFGVF
jgi:hypothetical protein